MFTTVPSPPSASSSSECLGVASRLCPWMSKDFVEVCRSSSSSSSSDGGRYRVGGEAVYADECGPVGVDVPTVRGTDDPSVVAPAAIAMSPRLEAEDPECAIAGGGCYLL